MKRTTLLSLVLALNAPVVVKAQITGIDWQRCYGGGSNESANELVATPDGAAFIGYTLSLDGDVDGSNHGLSDIWLVVTGADGELLQQYCFGGGLSEYGFDLVALDDGGFFIIGNTTSYSDGLCNTGSFDGWAARLDASGTVAWSQCIGGSSIDYVRACARTPDGGFLVGGPMLSTGGSMGTGLGSYDGVLWKFSATGTVQWTRRYGGTGDDGIQRILIAADGTINLIGYSNSPTIPGAHGAYDGWVARIQPDGTLIDQMAFGGTANEEFSDAKIDANGDLLISGYTSSTNGQATGNHGGADQWVVRVDAALQAVWQRGVGGSNDDYANNIVLVGDHMVLAGGTESNTGDFSGQALGDVDYTATLLSPDGVVLDAAVFGGPEDDILYGATLTADGSVLLGGESFSTTGDVTGSHGGSEAWLVKLDLSVGITEKGPAAFSVRPNPTSDLLTIATDRARAVQAVHLRDAAGRVVWERSHKNALPVLTLDMAQHDAGCYLLEISFADGSRAAQRVVKQ